MGAQRRAADAKMLGQAVGVLLLMVFVAVMLYLAKTKTFIRADWSPEVYAEDRYYRYHQIDCTELQRPYTEMTQEEAEESGYDRCTLCDPP